MARYLWITLGVALFVGLTFGLAMALDIPVLQDPTYIMESGGLGAAAFSVVFLALDIILPVPGSILMIGNGAVFGPWLGASLSLMGALLSTLIGFWLGTRGGTWLARSVSPDEQERARRSMERWGVYAVLITRPVPILSESILVMAAAMGLPFRQVMLASFLGLIPSVVIYALVGAYAMSLENNLLGFGTVIAIAGLLWVFGKIFSRTTQSPLPHDLS